MRSRERLASTTVFVLLGIFLATLGVSIIRRAESTSGYPSYSSLNNGNEGLKAYFDTLVRLGFATSRNFQPIRKLAGSQADLFYAGQSIRSLEFLAPKELEVFEHLAENGARVVLLLAPDGMIERREKSKTKREGTKLTEPTLKNRWGIEVAYREGLPKDTTDALLVKLGLVPFTWKFASWTRDWMPSQTRDASPLFLERHFGKGSILLISNAKLFTNRELLTRPDGLILAAVPGQHRQVIFDESHLGILDTGSVAGLATAHHLQWLLLGFIAVAVLYIWRSAVSFVPPTGRQAEPSVAGQSAYVALSRLLMQSVPKRSVLLVAAEEWNRSRTLRGQSAQDIRKEDLERLKHLSPAGAPAEYNALAKRALSRQLH
jgi:hypothetical protein